MAISKKDRELVFQKYDGKCGYCGCQLEKGWHVDHIEPIRRGWKYLVDVNGNRIKDGNGDYLKESISLHPENDVIENYMPSCPSCNINKHGDSIEDFRNNIQRYLRSLNQRMVQYKMVKKYGLVIETMEPVVFYFEKYQQQCQLP